MSKLSEERRSEVIKARDDMGVVAAAKKLGIKEETVRRYCREGGCVTDQEGGLGVLENDNLLKRIGSRYSEKELKLLAAGGLPMEYRHTPVHDFTGKTIRFGWITDTHIGSVYTDHSYLADAREEFARAGVDFITHSGDVTEGASNRPGHVYECSHYGYDAQKELAVELFSSFDFCPMYVIDGNHDRWYMKSNGARIVKAICGEVDSMEFIGHDEGDIMIGAGIAIKLWHGEDGSSYAHSYRIQKLIESLQGGQKPAIIVAGHVHKHVTLFERNIHCISAGCIQKQSKWMRGKRLPAHTGFGISEVTVGEAGIGRITNTFFPFYA